MIAHTRKKDGKEQDLHNHSWAVGELCFQLAEKLKLGHMAKLIGLLHDFGKGTQDFCNYLHNIGNIHPNHADLGARLAYERWFNGEKSAFRRKVSQLISLCIYGHHAGLPDCLNIKGESPYLTGLYSQSAAWYQEAMCNYEAEVASFKVLDRLFDTACEELKGFKLDEISFDWGFLTRLMMSILIDADRWDTACFEYDEDFSGRSAEEIPDWKMLLSTFEANLEGLPRKGVLSPIRREISERCKWGGKLGTGIYTLSAFTGSGKTFSSLRFALTQADVNQQQRIFYFIPYNTILDQNAEDIRTILDNYQSILEHHSNVMLDDGEEENYRRLTERWDSDIILSSLVQFLNTLYRKENASARRMHRLANSVLIFDEIQFLPKKCKALFEKSVRFLAEYCHCTVLLCTATQPGLNLSSIELIDNADSLYQKLKRVEYISQLQPRSYDEAAADIASFNYKGKSVLVIVNTKTAASEIYYKIAGKLRLSGIQLAEVKPGLTNEQIEEYAKCNVENEILCVHLSTFMCPEHRSDILRYVKIWLDVKRIVCCISTNLMEAGINVSFPIVIRSLAGVTSLIQAAGRCNRNGEYGIGEVFIWNLDQERLRLLPDVKNGKEISWSLLNNMENSDEIGLPENVQRYFAKENEYAKKIEGYPYKEWDTDLLSMLSDNKECKNAAKSLVECPLVKMSFRLNQSFRSAGTIFQVIDESTKGVIVPYGRGKVLIGKLKGMHTLQEKIRLFREIQRFSVNLPEYLYERLSNRDKVMSTFGESGVAILNDEYYNPNTGVRVML